MISAFLAKKVVREGCNHMNRGEIAPLLSRWDDDATLSYPGNMPASGVFNGKKTIEQWFRTFFEIFPKRDFAVKSVCVEDAFDFVGTNIIKAQWDVQMTDHKDNVYKNRGVTVIHSEKGKATSVSDYYFDIDDLREAWLGGSGGKEGRRAS